MSRIYPFRKSIKFFDPCCDSLALAIEKSKNFDVSRVMELGNEGT